MIKRPFDTPDGYFDQLKMRLSDIPLKQEEKESAPGIWSKVSPYLALATCFAVGIIGGRLILGKTAPAVQDDYLSLEQFYCSDLIPYTSQNALFDEDFYYEDASDEDDVLNYLLNSNLPLTYIMEASYEDYQ